MDLPDRRLGGVFARHCGRWNHLFWQRGQKFLRAQPRWLGKMEIPGRGHRGLVTGHRGGWNGLFGAHDKKFYALSPNGNVRWTFLTRGPIVSSPAIGSNGDIYFSSTDGNLYSLKTDGTEQWHYHTGSMTESSPVLDEDGNIYLGDNQNAILTFSPGGKFRWRVSDPLKVDQAAAVAGGRVYTTLPWRMLYTVAADSGKPLWLANLPYNLSTSLVIDADGTIYSVCSFYLYAITPPDGALPTTKSSWPMFRANARHTGRLSN